MEYWSVEKKDVNPFSHCSNTPVLQYSRISRNCKLPLWAAFFWVIDPKLLFAIHSVQDIQDAFAEFFFLPMFQSIYF
jgi:hypothetical protein